MDQRPGNIFIYFEIERGGRAGEEKRSGGQERERGTRRGST